MNADISVDLTGHELDPRDIRATHLDHDGSSLTLMGLTVQFGDEAMPLLIETLLTTVHGPTVAGAVMAFLDRLPDADTATVDRMTVEALRRAAADFDARAPRWTQGHGPRAWPDQTPSKPPRTPTPRPPSGPRAA